ncbi:MAG: penicillin acylase family protein, partial [Blastocatellia bacterium]|nr:penicillin acylase family protein [Blastocatellia bacterium]
MKKHLLLLCLAIALLIITNSAQSDIQSGTGSPTEVKTSLKLTGLKDAVTVYRDERGIPYIEASNEHDLYFAQGYVTATDRLWQMDLFRRNARGELSEIFGKATFEEDKRHKIYGFAHVADEAVKQSSPKALAALQAYADGVNAYIDATENQHLPIEFQILSYRP